MYQPYDAPSDWETDYEDDRRLDREGFRCPNGHLWLPEWVPDTRYEPGYYRYPECPTCGEEPVNACI
jgi:hypothetical protein